MNHLLNWEIVYITILRDGGTPLLRSIDEAYDISPRSVRKLRFSQFDIKFLASFNGNVKEIIIPINKIKGIDDIGLSNYKDNRGL